MNLYVILTNCELLIVFVLQNGAIIAAVRGYSSLVLLNTQAVIYRNKLLTHA